MLNNLLNMPLIPSSILDYANIDGMQQENGNASISSAIRIDGQE